MQTNPHVDRYSSKPCLYLMSWVLMPPAPGGRRGGRGWPPAGRALLARQHGSSQRPFVPTRGLPAHASDLSTKTLHFGGFDSS